MELSVSAYGGSCGDGDGDADGNGNGNEDGNEDGNGYGYRFVKPTSVFEMVLARQPNYTVGGLAMNRWKPPVELTAQEQSLLKRLNRVRPLFRFLRLHRHELFDDAFQEKLEAVYRDTGAGEEPHPPALLCMVVLLQGYVSASDAEAVELSVVDLRWQMVLGCLGATTPPFSQGGLQTFRERMVAHELDRALLERTVSLVRSKALAKVRLRWCRKPFAWQSTAAL